MWIFYYPILLRILSNRHGDYFVPLRPIYFLGTSTRMYSERSSTDKRRDSPHIFRTDERASCARMKKRARQDACGCSRFFLAELSRWLEERGGIDTCTKRLDGCPMHLSRAKENGSTPRTPSLAAADRGSFSTPRRVPFSRKTEGVMRERGRSFLFR